jgi:hypothetical protein
MESVCVCNNCTNRMEILQYWPVCMCVCVCVCVCVGGGEGEEI